MTIEEIKKTLDERYCAKCKTRNCRSWNEGNIQHTMKCGGWHWKKEQLLAHEITIDEI